MQSGSSRINCERGQLIRRQCSENGVIVCSNHMHIQICILHDKYAAINECRGDYCITVAMTLSLKHPTDHANTAARKPGCSSIPTLRATEKGNKLIL